MRKPRIKIPKKKINEFCRQYHIQRMAIFGSALRDDFGPESDIDILVTFEPGARVGFMTLGRMKRELTAILARPVDLVPQEGLKPVIRESVLASAEEIYAA